MGNDRRKEDEDEDEDEDDDDDDDDDFVVLKFVLSDKVTCLTAQLRRGAE